MTNNQLWFLLIVAALLIAGWALGYASHNLAEQDHRRNIECIEQGGRYEPVDTNDYQKLICKK